MHAQVVRRVFSVVTLTFVVTASAAEPWQERRFSIADRGTLVLSTPLAWTQQTGQSPPTIRFYNSTGQQFVVLITALWSPTQDSLFNSSAKVRALVDERAEKFAPQAVECELPIHEMHGASGSGFYFSATDKPLVPTNTSISPRERWLLMISSCFSQSSQMMPIHQSSTMRWMLFAAPDVGLSGGSGSSMALAALLRPWPSEEMEAWEVSPLVNAPENDSAACIQPVSPMPLI